MFNKLHTILVSALVLLAVSFGPAQADQRAAVEALMNKAVAHYLSVGQEQAIKDFSGDEYRNGELYVVVQGTDGSVIAHPINPKLNGRNLIGMKDTDGKTFVKEMSGIAKDQGEGWLDYKWVHPQTKKIANKTSMVKRVADGVFLTIGYYN